MNHSTIAYRCCICTLVLSSNYPRLEDAEVIPTDTSIYGTVDSYTHGEVMSQSLWSRYERHFVGITRYITR